MKFAQGLLVLHLPTLLAQHHREHCAALRIHRDAAEHLTLPSSASSLLTGPGNAWSVGLWVRVLEGRPSAIVHPVLHLIETPLGMRLRGCASTRKHAQKNKKWRCATTRKLWLDDGEWHHLAVTTSIGGDDASDDSGLLLGEERGGGAADTPHVKLFLDGSRVEMEADWAAEVDPKPGGGSASTLLGGSSSSNAWGASVGASPLQKYHNQKQQQLHQHHGSMALGFAPLSAHVRDLRLVANRTLQDHEIAVWANAQTVKASPTPKPSKHPRRYLCGDDEVTPAACAHEGGGEEKEEKGSKGSRGKGNSEKGRAMFWRLNGSLRDECGGPSLKLRTNEDIDAWDWDPDPSSSSSSSSFSSSEQQSLVPAWAALLPPPRDDDDGDDDDDETELNQQQSRRQPHPSAAVGEQKKRGAASPSYFSPAASASNTGTAATTAATTTTTDDDDDIIARGSSPSPSSSSPSSSSHNHQYHQRDFLPNGQPRTLVEIYRSNPPPPPLSKSNNNNTSTTRQLQPPLLVLYYSSSPSWDAYWALYHHWTVGVLLAEVVREREVRVLLDRCEEPCTMETIAMAPGSLAVLNKHSSPQLDPQEYAAEARRRGIKGVALLHQNHEKPWTLIVGNGDDKGGGGNGDKGGGGNDGGSSGGVVGNKELDWRNGYAGGISALAAAYTSNGGTSGTSGGGGGREKGDGETRSFFVGVMRQYYYRPLFDEVYKKQRQEQHQVEIDVEEVEAAVAGGAAADKSSSEAAVKKSKNTKSDFLLYVPLGPAWHARMGPDGIVTPDDNGLPRTARTSFSSDHISNDNEDDDDDDDDDDDGDDDGDTEEEEDDDVSSEQEEVMEVEQAKRAWVDHLFSDNGKGKEAPSGFIQGPQGVPPPLHEVEEEKEALGRKVEEEHQAHQTHRTPTATSSISLLRTSSSRKQPCFFAGAAAQFGGTADREEMLRVVMKRRKMVKSSSAQPSPHSLVEAGGGGTDLLKEMMMVAEAQKQRSLVKEAGGGVGGGGTSNFFCEVHLGSEPERVNRPSKRPLSRRRYLRHLRSTVFALAPSGNNPETFRHWEALESGALPVSVAPHDSDRSYLGHWCNNNKNNKTRDKEEEDGGGNVDGNGDDQASLLLPWTLAGFEARGCPLVVLDSWSQLPAMLEHFFFDDDSSSPDGIRSAVIRPAVAGELDEMQRLALIWVKDIKTKAAKEIKNLLAPALS